MAPRKKASEKRASPQRMEEKRTEMLQSNFGLKHSEFGVLEHTDHLYKQQPTKPVKDRAEELVPYVTMVQTYILYLILIAIGHVRDFLDARFRPELSKDLREQDGYAPILTDFDSFYTRRLKTRLEDLFAHPTTGVPGRIINVFRRKFKENKFFELEDVDDSLARKPEPLINLSSYNYLGFAQSAGRCADDAEQSIEEVGTTIPSTRFAGGNFKILRETEALIADFLGKEAAMIFSMGYGTNSMFLSNLIDKRCLVLSDQLNHASLRTGVRMSGAVINIFKHNDMDELERIIREQIAQGQPRSRRPWDKILIVFEGLYSMEGTMCDLPRMIELRRKYGVYLFMDEAHSVGAMGPTGRGICDYYGVDPKEVDILMGTFTKSFGSVGGYIAGSQELINRLMVANMNVIYGEPPTPAGLQQIQTSLRILRGEVNPGEGEMRLQRLAFNSRYLRIGLKRMGFVVSGHIDSPVVPVFLFHPTKLPLSAHWMFDHGIAIVVVGYPATDLTTARIRFCLSSAVTKGDLDHVLEQMEQMGDRYRLKVALGLDGEPAPRERFSEIRKTLTQQALDPTIT